MLTIRDCTVLDAQGEQENVDVLIENDVIKTIVPTGSVPNGTTIDATGWWLIPGLIDLHTHMVSGDKQQGFGDEARAFRMEEPVAMAAFRAVAAAKRTLESGVTTVREIVARDFVDVEMKRAVEDGLIDGPDIVPAGPGIAITGGHGGFMNNESDGAEETRRLVRRMIKRGVEVIKILSADGPELTGDWTSVQSTFEEIQAAFTEAKRHGRICCAHAMGPAAISNVVRAGADTVEHGWYLNEECCELMKEHGVTLIPTIGNVFHIVQDGPAYNHPWVEEFGAREDEIYANLRLAVDSGVAIAMGSDCGGNEMRRHGQNPDEIELYVDKGGMSPRDAIVAGTLTPARILGRADRIGTVEPGKLADLVLLGSSPLDDIHVLTAERKAVLKRGRIVEGSYTPEGVSGTAAALA